MAVHPTPQPHLEPMARKETRKLGPPKLRQSSDFVKGNMTILVTVMIAFLGYALYKVPLSAEVLNSQNKDTDTLKLLLMGEDPGVFYCHGGISIYCESKCPM